MKRKEHAVSPVIGVLLMLTLTLIIAAIVNSYAGGLIETEPKAPAATLQVTFSQTGGMEIRHVSGDPIPTSSIKLIVRPSETMGRNASQYTSIVDKKYITNNDGISWSTGVTSFKPGDVSYIKNESEEYNLSHIQDDIGDQKYSVYWFNQTPVGNTFYLEVYYKNTMISKNEVLIEN